jgi:Rrf2 family protein
MLRLSKRLLFAVEAVVDIAYHAGSNPVRSIDISRRQGIPRRYLEQVLQHLVHHDILTGQRGPRGGYRLAREKRRISLGEIIRIVNQLEAGADPASNTDGSDIGVRVVRPLWSDVQNQALARFDEITIDQLCETARQKDIPSEATVVSDFVI